MTISQLEHRERLCSKCLDLAATAFQQQDPKTAIPLLSKAIELTAINFAAMRLEHGSVFDQSFIASPVIAEFVDLVRTIGGQEILEKAGLADLVAKLNNKGGHA